MFFNVSREKSGRPGRSGDVMDAIWDTVSLSPPTHPCKFLHVEKLASTVNGTAAQHISHGIRVKRTMTMKGTRDRRCELQDSLLYM